MELLSNLVDIFLHLDKYLNDIVSDYGTLTYLILFAVIFCETGLVVTPFLPGDSLLFATGALAAISGSPLNVFLLFVLLTVAAILGDTANFHIAKYIGANLLERNKLRLIKKEHLERTHKFYEKHGGKTIILARFIPIIRTFAPFVAGIGKMNYFRFISYNVIGGIAWISIFLFAGYGFGNVPAVKKNFTLVIFGIIFVSVLPAVFEFLRSRKEAKKARS
ncbi:MAG: DedA family protein [Clostridia bacterium]|nr:DedA family protein [Clostridia bacterium]